jgi:hypothetical protein
MLAAALARLVAIAVLASTVGSVSGPRRPPRQGDDRLDALAAQVDRADPTLARELRWVSRGVVSVVGLLEVLLGRFADLEGRLDRASRPVGDQRGVEVDDELFNRLAERLEVWQVREALQRLEDAHPDAPRNDRDHGDRTAG